MASEYKLDSQAAVSATIADIGMQVAIELTDRLRSKTNPEATEDRVVETMRTHAALMAFVILEGTVLERMTPDEQTALKAANRADLERLRLLHANVQAKLRHMQTVH